MPGPDSSAHPQLQRTTGLAGAVLLGLGSIIGTGVFVSIGLAAGIAGAAVIPAILIAAGLAFCNALSSAQLAALHPVSGGTYEYAYQRLSPALGFIAGWMFLCAKTASAAAAALGFGAYLAESLALTLSYGRQSIALTLIAILTIAVALGLRRAAQLNALIVAASLSALVALVVVAAPQAPGRAAETFAAMVPTVGSSPQQWGSWAAAALHAAALMFVAFTGYGRLATLGEEVRDPARTIPRSILLTLALATALYVVVGFTAICTLGAPGFALAADTGAPLEAVAQAASGPALARVVAIGALAAMAGVLLNLILGLSRVLLAMARRRDMPGLAARLNRTRTTPVAAVWIVGTAIAALAAFGSIKAAWSFSAFTVLVYYALTNLAALRLRQAERRFHPAFAWTGLAGCLFLAAWVDARTWATGVALIAVGLLWRFAARRLTA